MTVNEIACVCDGEIHEIQKEKEITNITINSNKCNSDSLFIAISNKLTDNTCYINHALNKNSVIISSAKRIYKNSITVKNTDEAFKKLAQYCRLKNGGKVITITGSVGKTTLKELCVSIISKREKLKLNHTEGNKNNLLGLPLTLMQTEPYDTTVLEAGISEPGEMTQLSEISKPDIAVITKIGKNHSKYLGSREEIAKEKLHITDFMHKNGTLIIPSSDDFLSENTPTNIKKLTVGEEETADFQIKNITESVGGTSFDIDFNGSSIRKLYVPIVGIHGAHNAAFSVAASLLCNATEEEIRSGLSEYVPCGDRQKLIKKDLSTVISDCYNASPESMLAAFDAFPQIYREHGYSNAKKILLIGDMLELSNSENEHFYIGKKAASLSPDLIIAYGSHAQFYIEGAVFAGLDKNKALLFTQNDDEKLCTLIKNLKNKNTVILIKGSRRLKLDRFVRMLTAEA